MHVFLIKYYQNLYCMYLLYYAYLYQKCPNMEDMQPTIFYMNSYSYETNV